MPKPKRTRVKSSVVTAAPTAAVRKRTWVEGTSQKSIVKAMKSTTIGTIVKMRSDRKRTRRYLLRSRELVVVNERPISSGPQKKSIVKAMIFCRYARELRTFKI